MFCIYLRTNSDLCHLQHRLIGFYKRDEKCLQRGTDWVFKYSGLRFVFKGLIKDISLIIVVYMVKGTDMPVHVIKIHRGSEGMAPLVMTAGIRWR